MISPSRPERNDEPPAPGLKVRRSEALEEARRRSRPRDISLGTKMLGPFFTYKGKKWYKRVKELEKTIEDDIGEKGRWQEGKYFNMWHSLALWREDPHLQSTSSVTRVHVLYCSVLTAALNPTIPSALIQHFPAHTCTYKHTDRRWSYAASVPVNTAHLL